ncbi:MAG: RNA 2',3'-cyclic phosphodiesterase [Pseudomonadota bacterium]
MPRLFTGLELPREVGDQLSLLQGGLQDGRGGARWIDRDNFHVTLRFIGDVDHGVAREVVSALDRVRHGPITLKLDGLASFGGNKPHSIFVRIAPSQELSDLQGEQERIAQRLGLKAERRTFIPHITLARCRGLEPGAVAHWLSLRGGIMNLSFEVERFVLYSSRDSVGGGPYVVEEDYPLVA